VEKRKIGREVSRLRLLLGQDVSDKFDVLYARKKEKDLILMNQANKRRANRYLNHMRLQSLDSQIDKDKKLLQLLQKYIEEKNALKQREEIGSSRDHEEDDEEEEHVDCNALLTAMAGTLKDLQTAASEARKHCAQELEAVIRMWHDEKELWEQERMKLLKQLAIARVQFHKSLSASRINTSGMKTLAEEEYVVYIFTSLPHTHTHTLIQSLYYLDSIRVSND
jgi:hypothetical protein